MSKSTPTDDGAMELSEITGLVQAAPSWCNYLNCDPPILVISN